MDIKRFFLFCWLALIVAYNGYAKDNNCNDKTQNQSGFQSECPLFELHDLRTNPPKPVTVKHQGKEITLSSEQLSATIEWTYLSILGDEKGAQTIGRDYEAGHAESVKSLPELLQRYQPHDAIPAIVEAAKDYQVVMLNEAHHVSMHRHFAQRLATALREIGFTHIAAETFANPRAVESMNERGYPLLSSGTYTPDPEFAQFLRHSASLGYGFVYYEAKKGQGEREYSEAKNLADFLSANPDARLLVFAGYSHIREVTTDSGTKWMGKQFKDMTGIDPLTIDQAFGTGSYNLHEPYAPYSSVESEITDKSTVFKNDDNQWLATSEFEDGAVDITVFHPRETIVNGGRASWLANDPDRLSYTLVDAQLSDLEKFNFTITAPFVVKAFVQNEWEAHKHQAIPMDQVLVEHGNIIPQLLLPEGKYNIRIETLDNPSIEVDVIHITGK